jgi:hypothetical protein
VVEFTPGWAADWAWSIPLILVTVMMHALGLLFVEIYVVRKLESALRKVRFRLRFPVVISSVVLLVTVLHGVEASVWASVYKMLGALPADASAMLYSLSAITSYGHAGPVPFAATAVDGRAGGAQRRHVVWFDDGLPHHGRAKRIVGESSRRNVIWSPFGRQC